MKKLQLPPLRVSVLRAGRALLGLSLCLAASHVPSRAQPADAAAPASVAAGEEVVVLEKFSVEESSDPNALMPTQPISVLGLSKTIVETPRSVSAVSSETIEKFNITELADLSRFSPSTYTAFSFGVQGGLQIRGDSADTYFGDMKKINNASNLKTIIGASDGVTIVRGPPSAVLGAGSVGGFMNYLPKSARATSGKYLEKNTGKVSATLDNWGKRLGTFEVGGPLTVFGKRAGFYVYTQREDSETFYRGQNILDQIVQATLTVDLTDAFRLEMGGNFQYHDGTGIAGWNRITQDLIDDGTYQAGSPNFALIDTDGNGVASRAELVAARLRNNWNFNAPGDPVSTPNATSPYNPANTTGPLAFVTNVHTADLSPRNVLLERVNHGTDYIAFVKLVNDANPNLVFKNNLFFEHQDYYKLSDIAYFRAGDTKLFEERFTVEWKPQNLPDWLTVTNLSSFNMRYLDARNSTTNAFQLFSYWDLTRYTDGHYLFQNGWDNPVEAGVDSITRSQHLETGVGNLIDITAFDRLSLAVGARMDWVDAEVQGYPGASSGSSYAKTAERGSSLTSASLSYKVLPNIIPYVTYATPKSVIPGSTGGLSTGQLEDGILVDTELKEIGVKAEFFDKKLFVSYAAYEQYRTAFSQSLNDGNGGFQQTKSVGHEIEVRYVPTRSFNMAVAMDWLRRDNEPLAEGFTPAPADQVGLDPITHGGGRYQLAYDPEDTRVARPDKVFSVFGNYIFGKSGWDVSAGANYTADYRASRIDDIRLPSALTFSGDIGYRYNAWDFRLSVKNITDELFFTSTSGSAALIPQPGRTFTFKASYKF